MICLAPPSVTLRSTPALARWKPTMKSAKSAGLKVHMAQIFSSTFFIRPADLARMRAASVWAWIDCM